MEPTKEMEVNSSQYKGDDLHSKDSRGYLSDYEKEEIEVTTSRLLKGRPRYKDKVIDQLSLI